MFAAIFKRKCGREVLMANYTDCGEETRFCCSVTHARYAQTRIADTISIKISCARSFFLSSEGSRFDDPN